jgi:voltage-gated potassium channel Kch
MQTVAAVLGFFLIGFVLVEVFESLVLPRRVLRPFRFTRLYYLFTWRVWAAAGNLVANSHTRQTFLSMFGPLSLLILFAIWAAALILGFGFVHFGFAPPGGNLPDAIYLSGTTFTTLGYGDFTPATPAARVLSVTESATGFGFFAVVIAYLPVLYQAFGRREAFIALLDARAGSPPAAGRMFLRILPTEENRECLIGFLTEAERWAAELLEGHLSFPVLGQYRSQHDNQSWLAALACTLDATALLLTVIDGGNRTQARLTFAMARHAVVDLGLVIRKQPTAPIADRLSPERLSEMLTALRAAGVGVRDNSEAHSKLTELRGLYEPFIAGLASFYRLTVPEVWPIDEGPDNWRTSAWVRRAAPLTSLGVDPRDDHFG